MFQNLTSLSMEFAREGLSVETCRASMYGQIRLDRGSVSNKLRKLIETDQSLNWIEKSEFFCNHVSRQCCVFDNDGNPLIWDNAHLTSRSYSLYAEYVLKNLRR